MKWRKLGLIFEPDQYLGSAQAYASVPTAHHLGGDFYRIFFSSRDQYNRSQIQFFDVDITDPYRIVDFNKKPVLGAGPLGYFDDAGTMCSWIAESAGILYMYYVGWNLSKSVPFRNAIGLAISEDGGSTFSRYSDGPILDRGIHDPCFVASSCVLGDRAIWRMWYVSCIRWFVEGETPKHYYHIKYAESTDGIGWQRQGAVAIDFHGPGEYAISRPAVYIEPGLYRMWYSYRGPSYRIGYAESMDGVDWSRLDTKVGIDVSEVGWDSEMIEYPYVFNHIGIRYMLYNGNEFGRSGIGLAVQVKS